MWTMILGYGIAGAAILELTLGIASAFGRFVVPGGGTGLFVNVPGEGDDKG